MAKQTKNFPKSGKFFCCKTTKIVYGFCNARILAKNTMRVQKILKNGKNSKYEVKKGIYRTIKNTMRISLNKIKNTYRV